MKAWWIPKLLKFILLAAVGLGAFGAIVMLLWNAVIPELFGGPAITFWQAAALLLLSHILLRGWSPWRHTNGWKHDRWHHRFEKKLADMTPEDRERSKQNWHRRCSPDKNADDDQ